MFARARSALVLAAASVFAAGLTTVAASPASATVTRGQCTFSGPGGPVYWAICSNVGPDETWDIALTCASPAENRFITYYGGIVVGNGQSMAHCEYVGWTSWSWDIRNL